MGLLLVVLAATAAHAGPYRECVKVEIVKRLDVMGCHFERVIGERRAALRACADEFAAETLKGSAPMDLDKMDLMKRAANGDIDELAKARATKCGTVIVPRDDESMTIITPGAGK